MAPRKQRDDRDDRVLGDMPGSPEAPPGNPPESLESLGHASESGPGFDPFTHTHETRVAEVPPPTDARPPSKAGRKPKPTEARALDAICDWLEATNDDDMPDLARTYQVRILVADGNFTPAWQQVIPLIEERHSVPIQNPAA